MDQRFVEPIKNSDKNTEIKCLESDKLFVGCDNGYLIEFSMIEKTAHDLGKILDRKIHSIAKTPDNKSQFVSDFKGGFKELDIPTRKNLNSYPVKKVSFCVVTHDQKFLITVENGDN